MKELENFLLCNTCTMSYIFGTLDDFEVIKRTEMIEFKSGSGNKVPVNFVNVDL